VKQVWYALGEDLHRVGRMAAAGSDELLSYGRADTDAHAIILAAVRMLHKAKLYHDPDWEYRVCPVVPPTSVIEQARASHLPVCWESGSNEPLEGMEKNTAHRMLYRTEQRDGRIVTLLRHGSVKPVTATWLQMAEHDRIRIEADRLAAPWGFRAYVDRNWLAVAVKGDARTHEHIVVLSRRTKVNLNASTLPVALLGKLSVDITNRVRGVARVLVEIEVTDHAR
jgi:hypothetical protein